VRTRPISLEISFLLIYISPYKTLGKKKRRFEHLKVVGAVDGAVKDLRPKNSIGESCAPDQKFLIV
jgi:hypothetical protein